MFLRSGSWTGVSRGPLKTSFHSAFSSSSSCSNLGSVDDLDKNTRNLYDGLLAEDRGCLARSITLVESSKRAHALEARKLMTCIEKHLHDTKDHQHGFRLGLSGPPGKIIYHNSPNMLINVNDNVNVYVNLGAGKSTFIEAFGRSLTAGGHKVAVLAVDPSSGTTGGSLLGDKTRMQELTRDPNVTYYC